MHIILYHIISHIISAEAVAAPPRPPPGSRCGRSLACQRRATAASGGERGRAGALTARLPPARPRSQLEPAERAPAPARRLRALRLSPSDAGRGAAAAAHCRPALAALRPRSGERESGRAAPRLRELVAPRAALIARDRQR